MPRPRKCRRVCRLPAINEFGPSKSSDGQVILTVDEYEAIRLIDKEGLCQEECAAYMQVARTTVQSIYNEARKKLATAIVNGYSIRIEGGNYTLCNGEGKHCGCFGCAKHSK